MLQTYRKTVVSAFTMSISAGGDPRHHRQAAAAAPGVSARGGLSALRAAAEGRHRDIVTVLNTQLTLFQAEDVLWQASLPIAGDRQPLSGAGRWLGARMEKTAMLFKPIRPRG